MKIKIVELESLVKKVLLTKYKEEYVEMIKEIVMFGELTGRPSHGILRLVKGNYGAFVEKPIQGEPELTKKTKISTLVDGKGNPGMLIGALALKEVIRLAKDNGMLFLLHHLIPQNPYLGPILLLLVFPPIPNLLYLICQPRQSLMAQS